MSRNKTLPGTRLFLYMSGLVGGVRAAEDLAEEARAPKVEIHSDTRAEGRDVNAKAIWIAGIGVLVGLWAIVLLLYPLFTYLKYDRAGGKDPAKVLVYLPNQPPAPRNIEDPFRNLAAFRAREDALLNRYLWVDRGKGIVSIPIGRAMQIVAGRGIPPSAPGGTAYYPPKAGSMQTGLEGKVEPEPR